MSKQIGAPGTGISRRRFLAATGGAGALSLGGCVAPSDTAPNAALAQTTEQNQLPLTSKPEVVDLDELDGEVTISAVEARHHVHPHETMGGPIELPVVWAFTANDGAPSVPGPVLRATEGQEIELTLDNTAMGMPHTFHVHGLRKTWENDGVPTTTGVQADPGESHTYTYTANQPGTHLYHCHYNTPWHMEMGMYGVLRVDPEGYEEADKEYFTTVKEWDTRLSRQYGGENATYDITNRRPDAFTVNGRSAPYSLHPEEGSPMVVDSGDTVRVHFVNAGFTSHPLHFHNHRFTVVEKDGGVIPGAARHEEDVINVAPAERYTLELEADADPGIYLMHCHKVDHVRNGTSYPGGMLNAVVYTDAMGTDIFEKIMGYAGYEG